MAHWYIKKDDRALGPFGPTEMRRRVEAGKVKPETMVRKGSNSKFLAAKSFKGLIKDSVHSSKPDADDLELDDGSSTEPASTDAAAAASKAVAPEISAAANPDNDTLELAGKTTAVTGEISNNTANDLLDTSDTERLIPPTDNPDTVRTARTTRIDNDDASVPNWMLKFSKAYLVLGCCALILCLVSALRS